MSKFLSGRQSNLKLGVAGYTESKTVLQTTGKVGIGTTDAQSYSLYVVGDTNVTGLVSATSFYGDGSNLENTGATLSAAAGTQRLVVTSLTSGTMVDAATDSDLTFNATTNTLNTDNLIVAGNLTVSGDQTILNTTQLEVEDINIGIASASTKLNDAQLDGAGITIYGLNGDKSLIWDNSNSWMAFNTDLYAPNLQVGTGVTIYGNSGIVSATSFYGDGSNLSNTGATLSATSGVERLVTTQLTSGTMVDAATDADLTFNAGNNTLNTQNIQISGGISTNGTAYGQDGQLLKSTGTGWEWRTVPGIFSVNNILNGFNVLEEGSQVGTAGSIHTLDFRGINVFASGDPQPNGIATITFSPTPSFTGVNLTGVSTITGTITAGSSEGVNGQYLRHVGTGVTWASFPQLRVTQTNNATAGQTTFNFTYNIDFLDVFVNGVKLTSSEYSANNGSQIVLNTPAFAGEVVEFHSYNVASTYGAGGSGGASNLTGLSDVNFPIALADNQLLQFNSGTNVWENVSAATVVGAASSFATKVSTATTATAGQTTFSGTYTVGFVDVFLNGVKQSEDQYTATTGTNIVFDDGVSEDDIVEVVGLTANVPGSGGGGGGGSSYTNTDVDSHLNVSGASSGQILSWNGSDYAWVADQTGSSYANSDVDTHLNTGSASSGEILSWNGSVYDWVSQTAEYTNSNVDSHLNVSGASSGQILSWNGSDYAWVADQTGGGGSGITTANINADNLNVSGISTFNNVKIVGSGSNIEFTSSSNSGSSQYMKFWVGNQSGTHYATIDGSGGAFQIHNTSHPTGTLDFRAREDYSFQVNGYYSILNQSNGGVKLFHPGSQGNILSHKLETLGIGVTVVGTTFSNQLSVSGVCTAAAFVGDGSGLTNLPGGGGGGSGPDPVMMGMIF